MKYILTKHYHILWFFVLMLAARTGQAQNLYVRDVMGVPLQLRTVEDIKGSPYLYSTWQNASVKLKSGVTYKENMFVMYDQEKDELYFKGDKEEALAFVDPVTEFIVNSDKGEKRHFKNGFSSIPGTTSSTYFEVIGDGSVQLLKHTKAFVFETKDFDSALKNKSYNRDNKYYLVRGNKSQQIKPDKKSILNALSDKKDKLDGYIKTNSINFKSDEDLAKLITYYNSI